MFRSELTSITNQSAVSKYNVRVFNRLPVCHQRKYNFPQRSFKLYSHDMCACLFTMQLQELRNEKKKILLEIGVTICLEALTDLNHSVRYYT